MSEKYVYGLIRTGNVAMALHELVDIPVSPEDEQFLALRQRLEQRILEYHTSGGRDE